jgi:transposase-like protein
MTADIQNPVFTNDDLAREALEAVRWPNGPTCPHCGAVDRIAKLEGKSHRPGLYYCNHCKGQFTVTVGSVFERSKIGLSKWWLATYLLCSSKKGMSSLQLSRALGVTYKTAWFMTHRIREAMADGFFVAPMGGEGKTVEADEAFWGNEHKKAEGARGYHHKMKVFTLVERQGGARSFHVPDVNASTLLPIMKEQIKTDTSLFTDEAFAYTFAKKHFPKHDHVNHRSGEYVRGPVYTNTVESYFAILKRGLYGTYHHVSSKHLRRYCGEFDFRYNNRSALGVEDMQRTTNALAGIAGKRLTYRRTASGAHG